MRHSDPMTPIAAFAPCRVRAAHCCTPIRVNPSHAAPGLERHALYHIVHRTTLTFLKYPYFEGQVRYGKIVSTARDGPEHNKTDSPRA